MSTKRKLWWSLGALAMTLVVAGTSVGVTIAVLQARVSSGFSISYTAKNVNAVIMGSFVAFAGYPDLFGSGNETTYSPLQTKDLTYEGKNYVQFTPEEEGTKSFENFEYSFTSADFSFVPTDDSLTGWFYYAIFNFSNQPLTVRISKSESVGQITSDFDMPSYQFSEGYLVFEPTGYSSMDELLTAWKQSQGAQALTLYADTYEQQGASSANELIRQALNDDYLYNRMYNAVFRYLETGALKIQDFRDAVNGKLNYVSNTFCSLFDWNVSYNWYAEGDSTSADGTFMAGIDLGTLTQTNTFTGYINFTLGD